LGLTFQPEWIYRYWCSETHLSRNYPKFTSRLNEIAAVRTTHDYAEDGQYNPNIRSIVAYNTDSEVIPTVRSNGVLVAQVTLSVA
jgi:hypothetical protein